MKLRHLKINNFRGIRELDWEIKLDMICLIGPGDSTKSTILDAIEYVLSPNWALPISDLDFYQLEVENPIEITVVLAGLPTQLIQEDKFGLFLGFWNPQEGLHCEEKDGDEKALVVKLSIKRDLEPEWAVESPQEDKRQHRISASDRRLLGVSKIGDYTERDLAWGRNSALSRLTGRENNDEIPDLLAEAGRKVLSALQNFDLDRLSQVIQDVEKAAGNMGITPASSFRPAMDPERINVNIGAIALFDGNLPFHVKGAGSCRLLAMAIHRASVKEGSIILVDEVENSLEPYRLRQLIRELRPKSNDLHQVIFTTHSSVTVVECNATELYVVRSNEGKSTVYPVESSLKKIVRNIPEAFLTRSVIVCEGKTEAGLCRGLDTSYWQKSRPPLASVGVAPIEIHKGGGSEAPTYAVALAKLGYRVAYFGDSDRVLRPSKDEMEQQGIEVILWVDGYSTERRVCSDLPLQGLQKLIELAIALEVEDERPGEDAVWRKIHDRLNSSIESQPIDFRNVDQLKDIVGEDALREAIGKAAAGGNWFKNIDRGERLGNLLANYLTEMQGTETEKTIETIGEWCYA